MFVLLESNIINMDSVTCICFDKDNLQIGVLLKQNEKLNIKYHDEKCFNDDLDKLIFASQNVYDYWEIIMLTNEEIRNLALASGFKLKEQANGSMDLNPYVYEFARRLLGEFTKPNFKFVSELAYTVRYVATKKGLTMQDMADELGWEVHKISGVYNSRILLTKDEIHQLNNYLTQLDYFYSDAELMDMQKWAVFIDLRESYI